MTETVTVHYLINDTVDNETFTADRITKQHWDGGRAQVVLWRNGRKARQVSYRQAERIDRVFDVPDDPGPAAGGE